MYFERYLRIVQLLILSPFANLWGVRPLTRYQFRRFIIVESLENITINHEVKQLIKIVIYRELKKGEQPKVLKIFLIRECYLLALDLLIYKDYSFSLPK